MTKISFLANKGSHWPSLDSVLTNCNLLSHWARRIYSSPRCVGSSVGDISCLGQLTYGRNMNERN